MGLSTFEEDSSSSCYCCSSNAECLSSRLIQLSNSPFQSSHRFSHTPEWADGLDKWSDDEIIRKSETYRRHLDFHRDLGIYFPRHEKPNSAPTSLKSHLQINSKIRTNHLTPERIRQLLRREKDLLADHQFSFEVTPIVPTNTSRQSNLNQSSSKNEIHHPRDNFISSPCKEEEEQISSRSNEDTLKSLLKEHLTCLLTRGASTINSNRTLTSLQMKAQSQSIEQLIIRPPSTIFYHQRSTLGLTVTPLDLSSQRHIQSVTLEKMAQQRNLIEDNDSSSSSINSNRPITQPVVLVVPPPTYKNEQQQRVVLKRNLDPTNPSSNDIIITNEFSNKIPEQSQNIRKGPKHHRSSPKSGLHRGQPHTTTMELLPPIISGKRIHIPLANHRYL